jgi:STE24 endopeptidase
MDEEVPPRPDPVRRPTPRLHPNLTPPVTPPTQRPAPPPPVPPGVPATPASSDAGSGPSSVVRRPDVSSVLSAALALPAFLSSLAVMSLAGSLVLPSMVWLVPVLWILSGAVLFVPAIEAVVSRIGTNVNRPTQAELSFLGPLWSSVCSRAGIDGARYFLLIEESTEPNAFAAGGRTVAVTRAALRLPTRELEAVLAHELGHHLSAHPVVSRLAWWYALPVQGFAFLGGIAIRFVLFVGRIFRAFGSGLGELAAVLLALMLLTAVAFVSVWLLLAPLVSPLIAWAHRLGEFRADQTAARLGYGPALIETFRRWQYTDDGQPSGFRERLLSTHPSHSDRIRKLESAVR